MILLVELLVRIKRFLPNNNKPERPTRLGPQLLTSVQSLDELNTVPVKWIQWNQTASVL